MSQLPPAVFPPSRQVAFHQLLVAARRTVLIDALHSALGKVDPRELKQQIVAYVPADVQQILAAAGVRDEHVFPTPIVLEAEPTLVGYYRLLLGVPQKTFYGAGSGMGRYRAMEASGTLTPAQKSALPQFCAAMGQALAELIRQLSPSVTARDVSELPLLVLGGQFQGATNNAIGQLATVEVFLAIAEIVEEYTVERDERSLRLSNASGRSVTIVLAGDPDVRIQEDFGGSTHNRVAIEIKGGTDKSNAHNRAGEAEKSHQKARASGFRDFWTIITTKGLDLNSLRRESPTTTSWFDAAQVLGRAGPDWDDFERRLAGEVGIPLRRQSL